MPIIIIPAPVLGITIGLYEAIVIHRDVKNPTHRFVHTIHALVLSSAFVFVSMNAKFILHLLPFLNYVPVLGTTFGLQILVGLLAAFKIHAISQVSQLGFHSSDLGETWFHSTLIGGLVIVAPYAYQVIRPTLPTWVI